MCFFPVLRGLFLIDYEVAIIYIFDILNDIKVLSDSYNLCGSAVANSSRKLSLKLALT